MTISIIDNVIIMMNGLHGSMFNYAIIWIFVMVLIAIYVATDATKLGQNGLLWAIVVLLMPMMGIFVYLIVRSVSFTNNSTTQIRDPGVNNTYRAPIYQKSGNDVSKFTTDSQSTEYQFCTKCGTKNSLEAVFCNSCGNKILT